VIPMHDSISFIDAAPDQYDQFMIMMKEELDDYLEPSLEQVGLTWEEYGEVFRTVGDVCEINFDGAAVGFYWIELRAHVLHIHALILKPEFQNKGIGGAVLNILDENFRDRAKTMELGVHESNNGARALYERRGFKAVRKLDDIGFIIMQKPTSGA